VLFASWESYLKRFSWTKYFETINILINCTFNKDMLRSNLFDTWLNLKCCSGCHSDNLTQESCGGRRWRCSPEFLPWEWTRYCFSWFQLWSWVSAEIFPGGAKSKFCLSFSGCWRWTQIDVHKTLHLFYTTKKMPDVTSTVA